MNSIKPFGLAQKMYCLIIGMIVSITGSAFYSSVFYIAEPELKCEKLDFSYPNISLCQMWENFTNSQINAYSCYFQDAYYNLTIVNSLNLVCDKQYLLSWSQTLFFIGSICSVVNGIISDRLGRWKSLNIFVGTYTISLVVHQILMIGLFYKLSNMEIFIVYCIFQFISGFLNYCIYSVAYVLLFELTTESYRIPLSNAYVYFFVFGEMFLCASFYLTKNWILTNWILAIFASVSLALFWIIVPESPK